MKKSNKPIPQHLNDFLDWLDVEKGLSSKTQENYQRFIKKFFVWLKINKLSNILPHRLTAEHIYNYKLFLSRQYISRTGKNLKKSTQNYYLIALRALLSYFSTKDIESFPPDKIRLGRDSKEKTVKFLNLEQIEKLFSTPDINTKIGLRDRAILEVLFSTGIRVSELVALNREQFANIKNKKRYELSIIGKGGRPRIIFFSENALSWLKKYLDTRDDKENALFVSYGSKKNAPKRLTVRAIEKSIKNYGISAGMPIIVTPHVMRHSFSVDLLSKGVDIRTLQEFLGHKSIAATQIYTYVTSKRLRDIHQKFHGRKFRESKT